MDFRPDIGIERRTAGGCFCHDTYTKKRGVWIGNDNFQYTQQRNYKREIDN